MSQHYAPYKSCFELGLLAPNRYEIELLNEVLIIDFGQGAAKISEVKVGGRKKYLPTRPVPDHCTRGQLCRQIFFATSNFDLANLGNHLTKINL